MRILGIETSCDETAMSVMEVKGKYFHVLSHVVASQIALHQQYGGVFPALAKREHERNLPVVLQKAQKKARLKISHGIHAIAVTVGPGLDPCIFAGITFAKQLAKRWNVPLIPVDHMEGHLLISLLWQSNKKTKSNNRTSGIRFTTQNVQHLFPAVALLVSGGHTQLLLVNNIGKYQLLGETRDDAAGECFDKTARMLGLPYPGGPAISAMAAHTQNYSRKFNIKLPRPMMYSKDYDFSFSGLKTAVLYDWKSRPGKTRKSKEYIYAMAKEIQQAVIDVLVAKTINGSVEYDAKSIVLGGGVAANSELRRQLKSEKTLLVAPPELCTDNGIMPSLAGLLNLSKKKYGKKIDRIGAKPNLSLQ